MIVESNPKYEALKAEADGGYWGACFSLARLYEKYDQDAEAFKYWECAYTYRKTDAGLFARHLAGHYFYGIGVEADVEKAAMYLILSQGKAKSGLGFVHREKKNTFSHPYSDVIDIPDFEQKFKAGAELAKKNTELHEKSDAFIDSQLSNILRRIKKAKDGTWFHGPLFFWLVLSGFAIFVNVMRKIEDS